VAERGNPRTQGGVLSGTVVGGWESQPQGEHVRDCAGGAGQPGSLRLKRHPPGNRLEALKDDRKGQHSIRINDQWRLCFVWTREGAADVEIVDYH